MYLQFVFFFTDEEDDPNGPCVINVKLLKDKFPLIIDDDNRNQLRYPDKKGFMHFYPGQRTILTCALDNYIEKLGTEYGGVSVICRNGEDFYAPRKIHNFYTLTCAKIPEYEIRKQTSCGSIDNCRKYEIGFSLIIGDRFLKIMDIYQNKTFDSIMYVKSEISRVLAGGQKLEPEPSKYDKTECCSSNKFVNIENAYNNKTQIDSLSNQISEYSRLWTATKSLSVRHQLTAKNSFVYSVAARATFTYLNVVPQWSVIKDGNLVKIENHVNEMANTLERNLIVYTGVSDRMKVNVIGKNDSETLFLYHKRYRVPPPFTIAGMPIPLYTYKIVVDPIEKEGVVFVTVNHPDIQNITDYYTCEYPLFSIPGVKMPEGWEPKNTTLGLSYMCTVRDFLEFQNRAVDDDLSDVCDLLYIPDSPAIV